MCGKSLTFRACFLFIEGYARVVQLNESGRSPNDLTGEFRKAGALAHIRRHSRKD